MPVRSWLVWTMGRGEREAEGAGKGKVAIPFQAVSSQRERIEGSDNKGCSLKNNNLQLSSAPPLVTDSLCLKL